MTADRQTQIVVAFLSAVAGRSIKELDASEVFRRIAADVPDVTASEIASAGDAAKRASSDLRSLAWHLERAADIERRRRAAGR